MKNQEKSRSFLNVFSDFGQGGLALHPRRSGQAMIELAIVLPVLLFLMLGVIEMGRYMYIGILVGNAARAGAAYGSKNLSACCETTTPTGIERAADNDFQSNGQNVAGLTITSITTCGCDNGGTISSDTVGNCNPGIPPSCRPGTGWSLFTSRRPVVLPPFLNIQEFRVH